MSRPPEAEGEPLRLCVITNSLSVGGSETQLMRLCRRLDPRVVHVEVVCYGRDTPLLAEFRETTPARVTLIDKQGLGRVMLVPRLARHLRNGRYDVVHCWHDTANQYGLLAGLLGGCRCILTGHRNMARLCRWLAAFDRCMARFTAGRVVNSHAIRVHHSRTTGYPLDRIFVLHNGLDVEEFRGLAPREEVRRSLGLPVDGLLVVLLGRFYPVKGQDCFVRMAQGLTRRGYDACFALVGEGPARPDIEKLVAEAGLADRVHFPGLRRNVAEVLAASDVSVCASRSEGLPNVVLESMMAGVAVVTTDNGGGPELVGNREQVVPVGDAEALAAKVALLLDRPDVRRRWAEHGRQRALALFTIDRAAERYVEILRQALGRSRPLL